MNKILKVSITINVLLIILIIYIFNIYDIPIFKNNNGYSSDKSIVIIKYMEIERKYDLDKFSAVKKLILIQ